MRNPRQIVKLVLPILLVGAMVGCATLEQVATTVGDNVSVQVTSNGEQVYNGNLTGFVNLVMGNLEELDTAVQKDDLAKAQVNLLKTSESWNHWKQELERKDPNKYRQLAAEIIKFDRGIEGVGEKLALVAAQEAYNRSPLPAFLGPDVETLITIAKLVKQQV